MAKTIDYDVVGSYNNQRISPIDAERSVNLFEYIDALGKKQKSLIFTSGLLNAGYTFGTETLGFRAQFVNNGQMYCVVGNGVFLILSTGVLTQIGQINTTNGYVGVDANTFQVIFVDGMNGWIYDTMTTVFTQITDVSFPAAPLDVCMLDNFFVVINGGTNQFQLSMLDQGLVWGPDTQTVIADDTVGHNWLTLTSTADYRTGVPFQLSVTPVASQTFTADDTVGNNWLILSSTANYPTGAPFTVTTTGTLPAPLMTVTTYYAINVDGTHIRAATSYANAIANMPITLTTNGTPTNTITGSGSLPMPLTIEDTYYAIGIVTGTSPNTTYDPIHIRVASSLANAEAGIAITLTSNGSPTQTITSLGQLQEAQITTHPGTIVACRTLHRRLFLFSQNYTEVWENAGSGTNLPFRRNNSLLMEVGTPAIGSIATGFDMMFFLSQDKDGLGPVMMVRGTESIPASNRALDVQLAIYAASTGVADCRAFMIKENGMIFYRMNFTSSNHTYIYNVSQSDPTQDAGKKWHEEEVLDFKRHLAQTHAYFNGINYVGSYIAPILYQISGAYFDNDGEPIRRMRITKPFTPPGYQRIRVDRLQLDLLQGSIYEQEIIFLEKDLLAENSDFILTEASVMILLDQEQAATNPQGLFVLMSVSKDGGQTYGFKQAAPMGNIGQRTFRTLWRKVGTTVRGQSFVAKFEFYGVVPFAIMGASWAIEILPE